MKRLVLLLATVGAMLALYVGAASAQTAPPGVLDANNLNDPSAGYAGANVNSSFANGQTFIAEHSGALTGARVYLAKINSPGDLTVQVANVDGTSGLPAVPADVLASATIPSSDFPTNSEVCVCDIGSFLPVDIVFDAPASVVVGKKYALILKATGSTHEDGEGYDGYIQLGSSPESYAKGMRIFQRNPFESPPSQWEGCDVCSDTTFGIYVDPDTVPYTWTGILQPINGGSTLDDRTDDTSVFKLGSTIPVKFKLTGGSASITDATAKITLVKLDGTPDGSEVEATSTNAPDSGSYFRYDPTAAQYIFNLGTKGLTAGDYLIKIDLGDGTTATNTVKFSLR